ncbi:TonB-dependent receptor [Prevotella intermedia]|uniref:TonB-dependent receptor n=1 Tax=Prevotella intermedia TaxID=28131 RepID=A0AAD1F781_PREIN|nr:TonB-dependent receptor plug domain protein [Prevotella intermedia 17]BAR95973.1 TonB-dependent receptor [Prevotella intermedia]
MNNIRFYHTSIMKETKAKKKPSAGVLRRTDVRLHGKRLRLALLCLLCTMTISAQKAIVYGQITDDKTGEPIAGAGVSIAKDGKGTVADANGRYTLNIQGRQQVRLNFQYLGYKTESREIALRDSVCCNIRLKPADNVLDEVTVTTRSEMRKLRESAMPISVIGQRQLQGTASNINDVLARTVGVTVRNTGGMGSASRISVRGLEGKRMGMYIDETPMSQLSNFVALNDIPTNMIERIEVYKGIVPYKFGGSALGGAVNVVTKEYPPIYLDFSYEIGSFNTHQVSTVLKRTDRKSGLQFGVGGVVSYAKNNYKMTLANLDGRIVERDHDRFNKIMGGMSVKATQWWFDEMKWELIFMKTRQEIQGIDLNVREAYNHSTSYVTALTLKRNNFFLDGLDFDFNAGYIIGKYGLCDKAEHRYDWDGKVLPPVSSFGGEQNNFASDGNNRSNELTAKLNMGYTIDMHHALNLNIYADHNSLHPNDSLMDKSLGFRANFPSKMKTLTVGLSYDLTLFDGRFQNAFTLKEFLFSSHSRSIDIYSVKEPQPVKTSKNYIGFSNAMRYKFTNDLMLKASFNSEVRIPTSEELIGNGYSILASPALKPERTSGVNLGLLYRHIKADGGLIEVELNGFYNQLEDMIRSTPDMIPTMARYRNFGSVRTKGIELEAKGDICPLLYLYANGTYQDLRDVRKTIPGTEVENPTRNKRIPNVPYLLANFGAELHKENLFGGRGQNTRLLFDASYIHQYFYDFEVSKYQERKIPTSMTMDAALEHSFCNDRWTITFKVKNLTDRRIVSELNRPLPGRYIGIKVRYLFK